MPIRSTAAALLLAGCVTAPSVPIAALPRRCTRVRVVIELPRVLVTVDRAGTVKPLIQLGLHPACSRWSAPA